jgi:hypothetical protein
MSTKNLPLYNIHIHYDIKVTWIYKEMLNAIIIEYL